MSFLIDLHIHSDASPCSSLDADAIIAGVRAAGLDAIGLVDHEAFPAARVIERISAAGITVVPGAEITTPEGDVLLFGLESLPVDGMNADALVRWTRQRGGLAIVAHPCRRSRPFTVPVVAIPQLVVEVSNGRCTAAENLAAAVFAAGCPTVGGSDAHESGEIGRFATLLPRRPENPADLLRVLLAGAGRPVALFEEGAVAERLRAAV